MNSAGGTVVAPRVRLYVVDPRKFRKPSTDPTSQNSTVELPNHFPKAQLPTARSEVNGVTNLTVSAAIPSTSSSAQVNGHGPSSSNSQPNEVSKPAPKTTTKKKKPRKRKVDRDTATESDKNLKVFLATESTTRVGRLSKNPPRLSQNEVTSPSATSTAEPPPKIRIREPPDVFRCQACQKVYLGHTKLQLHYKTFPDHQIKNTNTICSTMHSNPAQQVATATSTQTNGFLSTNSAKSLVSVGIQVSFPPDFSTVDLRRSGSCSPASKNVARNHPGVEPNMSLRRMCESPGIYLADTMLPRPDSRSQPCLEPITVPDLIPPTSLSPKIENGLTNGFGDSAFSTFRLSTQNSSHQTVFQMNGHVNIPLSSPVPPAVYQFNPPFTPPGDFSHNACVGGNEKTPSTPGAGVRSIWDIVDDRIIQIGINQILTEISDVAERLSKLARDKFIPIREEEERLYCSSTIIQVDNPFLSHLLDLPFGTYVFREDAGVRIKAAPPPSAAELSLTGEVDVEKFLSPDILNLPHLTNIDFAAIL